MYLARSFVKCLSVEERSFASNTFCLAVMLWLPPAGGAWIDGETKPNVDPSSLTSLSLEPFSCQLLRTDVTEAPPCGPFELVSSSSDNKGVRFPCICVSVMSLPIQVCASIVCFLTLLRKGFCSTSKFASKLNPQRFVFSALDLMSLGQGCP